MPAGALTQTALLSRLVSQEAKHIAPLVDYIFVLNVVGDIRGLGHAFKIQVSKNGRDPQTTASVVLHAGCVLRRTEVVGI